jgi:beta-phosphoglucomutase-like phosphatase (HAD superfamily)
LYLPLVNALHGMGCEIITPAAESWVDVQGTQRRIRYIGAVATVGTGGDLLHTHAPEPMTAVLAAADAPPDLVIADHGWAGAAAEAGLAVVGFADTNDPALFVGAEEGKLAVVVPLDDNVVPDDYSLVASYVVAGLPHSA